MKGHRRTRHRVMVTLTPHWQNKLLGILSSTLGIQETFPQDHEIIMSQTAFAVFISKLALLETPPTLKQLKIQAFDLNKFPTRSYANFVYPEREDEDGSSSDNNPED